MPTKLGDIHFYTVAEVSHKLNVTQASVRNYIRRGYLKGQKLLGRWLIADQNFQEFLKKLE